MNNLILVLRKKEAKISKVLRTNGEMLECQLKVMTNRCHGNYLLLQMIYLKEYSYYTDIYVRKYGYWTNVHITKYIKKLHHSIFTSCYKAIVNIILYGPFN